MLLDGSAEGAAVAPVQAPAPAQSTALPPRPDPSGATLQLVQRWWTRTDAVPAFTSAVTAAHEADKHLFPQWSDIRDPDKGQLPAELRTGEDDRRIRTNLIYKNIRQMTAMTVPEDHEVKFVPSAQVGAPAMGPVDYAAQFAEGLELIVGDAVREAGMQEKMELAVQCAGQYRMSVLKLVFDRDLVLDSVKAQFGDDRDQQQNLLRLKALVEDYHRGVFTKDSADFAQMLELQQALKLGSELPVWQGLRADIVPLDCFRVDPTITDPTDIYRAKWMRHDTLMSVEDLRTKFPYRQQADGTWTGIHPEDLAPRDDSGAARNSEGFKDTYWTTAQRARSINPTTGKGESHAEGRQLVVAEIWSRADNRVITLVEGISYPVASWVPERTPSQWYPFLPLVLNPVVGRIYGISDEELMREIQARIHRKRTEEEQYRRLTIPRGIANVRNVDETALGKLKDLPPGTISVMDLGDTDDINKLIKVFQFPEMTLPFATVKDEQDLRWMGSLPEQMQGVTGNADYAAEVDAAMQGAAINSNQRSSLVRRWLERAYRMAAELLIQEMTPEDARAVAGPATVWPQVYGMLEGAKLLAQVQAQAKAQVDAQVASIQAQNAAMAMQAQLQAAAMAADPMAAAGLLAPAMPLEPLPVPGPVEQDTMAAQITADECLRLFGFPEPVTREVLFRRLCCKVQVGLNAQADRKARVAALQLAFSAVQSGGQAAAAAGMQFDPRPLLKVFSSLAGRDLTQMFIPLPPAPVAPGVGGEDSDADDAAEGATGDLPGAQVPGGAQDVAANPTTAMAVNPSA